MLLAGVVAFISLVVMLIPRSSGGDVLERVTPTSQSKPRLTGSYTEGAVGVPTTLNPLLATSLNDHDLATVLFRGLVRVDGHGRAQPDLASEWVISDDGLTYTFKLQPGIFWHDDVAFSTQDIRFTIGLMQSPDFPGDPALARFWSGVIVETPDDSTVIFRLLEPLAAFPNYATVPILPRHSLAGVVARDLATHPFSRAPIGTGPYRFVSAEADWSVIELEAVVRHAGKQPNIDRLSFRYFPDHKSLTSALRRGEVQGTGSLPLSTILEPGVLPENMTVYAPDMSGYTAFFMNLRDPLFSNVDVRRAIGMSIERESFVHELLQDRVLAGHSPIPLTSWVFQAPPVPERDTRAAIALLEVSGWSDSDGDGFVDDGRSRFSFPILVNADDPQRVEVAGEIQRQLSSIGLDATLEAVSSNEVSQALASREFSAAIFGWHSATGDPDCYQLWHSSQADDGLNFTGLRDPVIDHLLEEAKTTTDPEARRSVYGEFQRQFVEQVPAIVLYYPRYYFVVSSDVHGITAQPIINPSDRLLHITDWSTVDRPFIGTRTT